MIAVVKEHFRYFVTIVIISISLFLYFLTYDRFSARLPAQYTEKFPIRLSTNTTKARPTPVPTTSVIILAYMRSGSSLTGDILQQSPGAFYNFEPLHYSTISPEQHWEIFVNGTKRSDTLGVLNDRIDTIRDWLNCRVTQMKAGRLLDSFMNYGKKTKVMKECFNKKMDANENYASVMKTCTKELEALCQQSPIKIIKTIRLPLWTMSTMLEEFPGLKIVHLIRDPRAVLTSQSRVGMCTAERGGKEGCSSLFCNRIEKDVHDKEFITTKYPGRMLTIFYESIAKKPIETAKKMFEFIGTNFTKSAENYIFNITSANQPDNCVICTTRSNSTEHVDRWRKRGRPEFLKIITRRCQTVLDRFNYN